MSGTGELPFATGFPDPESEEEKPDVAVHRVSEINRMVRSLLEDRFRKVCVEGELSDVTRHASGHVYFTLTDPVEVAQLRGVMFRSDARRTKAELRRGEAVRFTGTLSLYPERGSYQLIARTAVPAGLGDLHAQFERLKQKLAAEGLLSRDRKRALPPYPRRVAVVTSAHGAALQDIIRVSQGRFPVTLLVSDCRVQGATAPRTILSALKRLRDVPDLDAAIVARGGGSAEDLWAFNDEAVARAIAACPVPVITGIGHETDLTISDLVSDCSAATPSNAAEQLLPEREAVVEKVALLSHRLERAMAAQLDRRRLYLVQRVQRLRDPRTALGTARGESERTARRLEQAMRKRLVEKRGDLTEWDARLRKLDVRNTVRADREGLNQLRQRLHQAIPAELRNQKNALDAALQALRDQAPRLTAERRLVLAELSARLRSLDPEAVLRRGYAIALHRGRAVLDAAALEAGDGVELRLAKGQVSVKVVDGAPPSDKKEGPL